MRLEATRFVFLPAFLLALASCSAPQPETAPTHEPGAGSPESSAGPTLGEIVDRHVTAMGGEKALDSIRNVLVVQEIVEPAFTVTGRYRATRDGRMRIDVYAGGERVFAEGLDDEGAWGWSPDQGFFEAGAEGEAALRHGIEYNLFGLHRFPERGHTLDLVGREEVEGVRYHVVGVTLADGFQTFLYIHPESWRIERQRDVRALHPDIDPRELTIETEHLEFERSCGVLRSVRSRQVDRASGEILQRSRTLERRCNLPEEELELGR